MLEGQKVCELMPTQAGWVLLHTNFKAVYFLCYTFMLAVTSVLEAFLQAP